MNAITTTAYNCVNSTPKPSDCLSTAYKLPK